MDPILLQMMSTGMKAIGQYGLNIFDNTFGQPTQGQLLRSQAEGKLSAIEESTRRAEGAQTQVLSSTKAREAGTGFSTASSSFTDYLKNMAEQFQMQDQFAQAQGMKSVDLISKAADLSDHNQFSVSGTLSGLFH